MSSNTPYFLLPLEGLLTQLKREGFHLYPDIYVGIQACLESHAQDWANYDRAALRADICLLVAKSEQERKRFFECFDMLYPVEEQLIHEGIEGGSEKYEGRVYEELSLPLLLGGVLLVGLLVFGGLKVWWEPVPAGKITVSAPRCNKVGNDVSFGHISQNIPPNTDFVYEYGDGEQDTVQVPPTHVYTQEGRYIVRVTTSTLQDTFHLQVYKPIEAKLLVEPEDVRLNRPITFSFEVLNPDVVDSLMIRWEVDTVKASIPELRYTFREAKRYTLSLSLQDKGDCEPLIITRIFDFRREQVHIGAYPFVKYREEYVPERDPWAIVYYSLLALSVILLCTYFVGKGFDRYNAYIPYDVKQKVNELLQDKLHPPYSQAFPKRLGLIQGDTLLFALATKFRELEANHRQEIDVWETLDATIVGGGIPNIRFHALQKGVSYLVLLEQGEHTDQQRKLFAYWMELIGETADVDMVQYVFQADPREVFHAESGKSVKLTNLPYLYPQHHLLFIGRANELFTVRVGAETTQPILREWVAPTFGKWKRRSLFTPKSAQHWSHKEGLLEEVFELHSMSPEGQWQFASSELPPVLSASSHILPIDGYSMEGLQSYFEALGKENLLKWLAATVVYPLPDLDICLLVGDALGYDTSYENLYALTRIPWMQTGDLSPALRIELLNMLSSIEQSHIREMLKKLLGKVQSSLPREDCRASLVFSIQQHIIDTEAGILSKKYLQYLSDLCRLPSSIGFSFNHRPKQLGMLFAFCILFCLSLLGWQSLSRMQASPDSILTPFLFNPSEPNPAIDYTNRAIDSLDSNIPLASTYLDTALSYDSNYEPALRYKAALGDKRAELAYAQGDFSTAIEHWQGQLSLQDSHHVHRLHSLGLCYFFQEQLDSARFYRDSLLSSNKVFLSEWIYIPNLISLLTTPDEIDSLLHVADSLADLEQYKEAMALYDLVLNLDPAHLKALEGKRACEEKADEALARETPATVIGGNTISFLKPKVVTINRIVPDNQLFYTVDVQTVRSPLNVYDTTMVLVKGGEHTMSASYVAKLSSFRIAKTEVTFEEYDRFCEATGRDKPSDEGWGRGKRPVINVNWYDAVEYCNWLSVEDGFIPCYTIDKSREDSNDTGSVDDIKWTVTCDFRKNGYRLPTEAEWEYAASGGIEGKGRIYAGTSNKDSLYLYGNYCDKNCEYSRKDESTDDGYRYTTKVGSYRPNELGLYDMSGNVWEWCWDWYSSDYPRESIENPTGVKGGAFRVLRGGSWNFYAEDLEVSNRNGLNPDGRVRSVGFRLARTLP